jgi:tetratricopeptide (TPR) repeat protein
MQKPTNHSSDSTFEIVNGIRASVEFNLRAIEREISDFQAIIEPSGTDRLRVRAMVLYYAGYYPQSRQALNALVALDPTARNLNKLAQVENHLGNHDRAMQVARRAISIAPTSVAGYETLGTALLSIGDYESAIQSAGQGAAIEQTPRVQAILTLAEIALSNAGKSSEVKSLSNSISGGLDGLIREFASPVINEGEITNILSQTDLIHMLSRAEVS